MKTDLLESATWNIREGKLLLSFAIRWFGDIIPRGENYSGNEEALAAYRFYSQQNEMICLLATVQDKLNNAVEMLESKTKLGA